MIKTMNKEDRLVEMYNYARSHNLCKNKGTFAELVGFAPTNLSRAFNGMPRFLTDNLLLRANEALSNVFSTQWLLTGEGEMYANNSNNVPAQTPTRAHTNKGITPSYDDDDLDYLRKRVKELEYLVDLQKKRIEQLESEAKKGYASVSVS